MKLETFFEKFDQFADAPDAVAKMRQLVLELAVQGRLVPQDARDASVAQELAELDLGILELDPRFDIPATWVYKRLFRRNSGDESYRKIHRDRWARLSNHTD